MLHPEIEKLSINRWISGFNWELLSLPRSPWAAPAFIVYQNGKPRMVVDYRRLNEVAISTNFPYQSKRIFYKHYPAAPMVVYPCASLIHSDGNRKTEHEKLAFRIIEDYGNLSECLSDIRTVPVFSSE